MTEIGNAGSIGAPAGARRPVRFGTLMVGELGLSIGVNIAFNMLFAWIMFRPGQSIALWGVGGLALDLLPACFFPGLLMTFGVTAALRFRLARGLSVVGGFTPVLPRRLWLRAVVVAVGAVAVIAPLTALALHLTWSGPWSFGQMIVFKLGFSVVYAVVVTPFVVLAALRLDPRPC